MSTIVGNDEQQAARREQEVTNARYTHGLLPAAHRFALRQKSWLTLLGLSAMFVVSALWHPPDEPTIILCPFRALTGHTCPGCGMTRAFCAIAHGEFKRAVEFNPLSPLLFLAALVVWLAAAATILNLQGIRDALARLRPTLFVSRLLLASVLIWWIVRLTYGL